MASGRTYVDPDAEVPVPPGPGTSFNDISRVSSRSGHTAQHQQQEEGDDAELQTEAGPPQMPQTSLTFLLVSGRRRTMSFEPDTTVGRVKELVWNAWPSGEFTLLYFGGSCDVGLLVCHPT
jgi:hypothetical protein